MGSAIVVYRTEDGAYSSFPMYRGTAQATAALMGVGSCVIDQRVSDSETEIRKLEKALGGVLKRVNSESMSQTEREDAIKAVFNQ